MNATTTQTTQTTQTTVVYNGREYRLERTDSEMSPYLLHGPKGACYGLIRNVHRPELLFIVNYRQKRRTTLEGWFREENGTIRQIS